MELLQLKYFYESAVNENFSQTANRHLVPPSTVSSSVKKLESELGCKLFNRNPNKITLNSNGQILKDALSTAFSIIDTAIEQISTQQNQKANEVSILLNAHRYYNMQFINEFKKAHPEAVFKILQNDAQKSSPLLDEFDVIIDEQSEKYIDYLQIPIICEKIKICALNTNPLCDKPIYLSDLKDEPFIVFDSNHPLRRLAVKSCKKAGFVPNIIIEAHDPQYIRKCVDMNLGIAFVYSGQEKHSRIKYLDVQDFNVYRTTCAYKSRLKSVSPMAKKFYEFLEEKFKQPMFL